MMRQPIIYGLVVFAAVFGVGFVTGMGGSFLPNLIFSVAMGIFAGICMALVLRFGKRGQK